MAPIKAILLLLLLIFAISPLQDFVPRCWKRIDRWWVRVHSFAHPNKTSNIANTTRQQLDVHTTQDANYQLSRAARFQCSFDMHHETMMMAVLDACTMAEYE